VRHYACARCGERWTDTYAVTHFAHLILISSRVTLKRTCTMYVCSPLLPDSYTNESSFYGLLLHSATCLFARNASRDEIEFHCIEFCPGKWNNGERRRYVLPALGVCCAVLRSLAQRVAPMVAMHSIPQE
jgi:hypothetical protein